MITDLELYEAAILIVDDQPMCVRLIEVMLRRAGFIMLRSTTDPRQVLDLCRQFRPDLLILDLHMPYLTGCEVIEQIRAAVSEQELPILAVTADLTPATQVRALKAGAQDFLTKPFDRLDLLSRVAALLKSGLARKRAA